MYYKEQLDQILSHFSIVGDSLIYKPMTDGLINDTFLVSKDDNPRYILQRINHEVFDAPQVLMGNITKALFHLHGNGYTPLNMITTVLDKDYLEDAEKFWRLMEFIPDSRTYNTTKRETISFEAGRIIGKFHRHLENAETSEFSATIPDFHDLKLREQQFTMAVRQGNQKRVSYAAPAIATVTELLDVLGDLDDSKLQLRVCHNDTKLNNILFSAKTDKALCLIDLDTLMPGYFYYDFGDAVRTIVNTAPEDEQDHSKITFERSLYETFVDGLVSSNLKLTKNEIHSLPLGVIYMPFVHGLRALTDYLNDDSYYKVAYEHQNLDRCLSLFDFAAKAVHEKNYMQAVLQNKFEQVS